MAVNRTGPVPLAAVAPAPAAGEGDPRDVRAPSGDAENGSPRRMVVELGDAAASAVEVAGGKGATLARLAARGLPVPDGAVVTTAAFAAFGEGFDLEQRVAALWDCEESSEAFTAILESLQAEIHTAQIPDGVTAALSLYLSRMEAEHGFALRWAVRSSAVAEDQDNASFAGQHDTVLGVSGYDEIVRALRTCWASFASLHAIRYRCATGARDFRAAVIVQHLVDAEAAGVAFTVDPMSGDRSRTVINANFGLGESVVGGQVTPDMYAVDKDTLAITERALADKTVEVVAAADGCVARPIDAARRRSPSLTDDQIRTVAELGGTLERLEERAVDYEWAVQGGRVYLLQSRPITSAIEVVVDRETPKPGWRPELDTPIDPAFPIYSSGNISEVLPGCITPLSWSYVGAAIDHSFRVQARRLGVPDDERDLRALGYFFFRPYLCFSFLAEIPKRVPGFSPDILYEELIGPPPRRSSGFGVRDLDPRRLLRVLSVALEVHRDLAGAAAFGAARRSDCERTTAARLREWSDVELVEAVRPSAANFEASVLHVWASGLAMSFFGMLRDLTVRWLGDHDAALASRLVTGIGGMPSADPAFGLEALAEVVRTSPELMAAFANEADDRALLEQLRDRSDLPGQSFCRELDTFVERFGHRAVCEAEFRDPCWRENPAQIVTMLRNALAPDAARPSALRARQRRVREQATYRARWNLAPPKRRLFAYVLERTQHFLALREQLKDLIILGSDRARRVYAELRRRLMERGHLPDEDAIFFLLGGEVEALTLGSLDPEQAAARVARRRAEWEVCQHLSLPKVQRDVPRWSEGSELESEGDLRGLGVSPGRVEGTARVVLDPRRDGRIEPGEILVCPVTDAGWTPLFVHAAALVVEVGGLLSHGSVVAREYGLPAVVGVAGATRRIRTGDRLRVDANAGSVVLLPAALTDVPSPADGRENSTP